jgi:Uri superfamily endonuclease
MLPDRPGTYVLILWLAVPKTITCGKAGCFRFPAGWYAYVGSAHGPGGLAARLARHLRGTDRPHWHIDYLRSESQPVEIWYTLAPTREECAWSEALLALSGAHPPVPGFGASDCRCSTHLVHLDYQPDHLAFARVVGGNVLVEIPDTGEPASKPTGARENALSVAS